MIVKKETKTKQNRKKKTQIKAATVRVHLLSQWHLTGHPEKKAGKQEQQCGCSSLARPRMAQSSLDEFANRSQLRAKCTRSSLSLLSSSHPPSTSRAILSIFEIKKKKVWDNSTKQRKPRKGEFVHTQPYFNWGKGPGGRLSHHLNCPQKDYFGFLN